jgi:hypothetical protein
MNVENVPRSTLGKQNPRRMGTVTARGKHEQMVTLRGQHEPPKILAMIDERPNEEVRRATLSEWDAAHVSTASPAKEERSLPRSAVGSAGSAEELPTGNTEVSPPVRQSQRALRRRSLSAGWDAPYALDVVGPTPTEAESMRPGSPSTESASAPQRDADKAQAAPTPTSNEPEALLVPRINTQEAEEPPASRGRAVPDAILACAGGSSAARSLLRALKCLPTTRVTL